MQIQISVNDEDDDGGELKKIMQDPVKMFVRTQLAKYIAGLKEEFSKGMILPKKDEVKPDQVKILTSGFNVKINMEPVKNDKKRLGLKIDTQTIKQTHNFQCTAHEFYDVFTRIELVTAFTRSEVKMEPVEGGKFELFGGNIVGRFDELIPSKKIVKQWRYKQWPEGHYSTVTINIDQKVCIIFNGMSTSFIALSFSN